MQRRSARATPAGSGSTAAGSGSDSPVRTLRSKASASARISRRSAGTTSPDAQQHQIARNQLPGKHVVYSPVSSDSGVRGSGLAQRLERLLAAVLGDDAGAHDRSQDHQHQQAVANFVEGDGQAAGDEEQDDERLARPGPDEAPERRLLRRLELIWTELGEPRRSLFWCEAERGVCAEPLQNGVDRKLCGSLGQVRKRVSRASSGALARQRSSVKPIRRAGSAARWSTFGRPPRRRP